MDLLKNCVCPHHPPDETGDPLFDIRTQKFAPRPPDQTVSRLKQLGLWWRGAWDRLRGHKN
jgi:hypothetical protein